MPILQTKNLSKRFDGGMLVLDEGLKLSKIKPCDISAYGITRTFQDVRLFNQMTVLDNILVVLTERNVFGSLFEKHNDYHWGKAKDALEKVSLWGKRNELAVNLSYGQRKLLEIARAVSTQAEIYLFDEPSLGLAPKIVKEVFAKIKEINDKHKTAIMVVEHNIKSLLHIAHRAYLLDKGKIIFSGKAKDISGEKVAQNFFLNTE